MRYINPRLTLTLTLMPALDMVVAEVMEIFM